MLLLTVTLLWFLPVVSERRSEKASLGWRRVLIRVTLLLVLCGVNEGHVGLRDPSSPVHGISEEYRRYDHETGRCNSDACASTQPIPANPITETNREI